MSRLAQPQLSFADLELRNQGVHLDPLLQGILAFLEDHATLVEQVRQDLVRGLKNPNTGRDGITPAQTLRSLILMRVKNWDYRELRERINDGYTLRIFTDFDSHRVPKHDAFNRAFNRLTPTTMQAINQTAVQAAVHLGLEDGKQLRVDTTVVETDIHFPTDATLLWDTVRTLTRLVKELHEILPRRVQGFTNRTRSARRRMQALERMTAQERHTQQEPKYRELLRITEQVLAHARQVVRKTARVKGIDVVAGAMIEQLRQQITEYCKLGDRVIDQTRRRVIDGEQVPAEEKVYSIFEPHTDLIKRGKARKPVEFGHKVFLAESAQGLITDYQVLDGNPADTNQVKTSLDRHQQVFQHGPELYAGDRGFYSAENEERCQQAGISQVSIPQRGGQKTAERQALEHSRARGPRPRQTRRVLIAGAGSSGSLIARELHTGSRFGLAPVGFVDDDREKQGLRIHDVPVLGSLAQIPTVVREYKIEEVVIAMPSASGGVIREVVRTCEAAGVPYKTLPGIHDLVSGRVSATRLRRVEIEDLLRREPVEIDMQSVASMVAGRRILVTGAGGSIGSELCRQILRGRPAQLRGGVAPRAPPGRGPAGAGPRDQPGRQRDGGDHAHPGPDGRAGP